MAAYPFRATLVREEIFRDENGHLDQIDDNDLKSWDYLKKTPAYVAEANVKVLGMQVIDKHRTRVIVDAYGEAVAEIIFDSLRNKETVTWLQTSKSNSPRETQRMYEHLAELIMRTARDYYNKMMETYRDRGEEAEFTAIAGRRVGEEAYEVTVSSRNDIIAVVQFTRINQQGALFWQKTLPDSHGNDTAQRYEKQEREVLEVARNYFYSKKVWPPKNYWRPTPQIKL